MEVWTLIFSGVGAVAASAAAYVGWLVYRWQMEADLPVISITVEPNETSNWYDVTITVVNRSSASWLAECAEVLAPKGAKMISQFDAPRTLDGYGDGIIDLKLVALDTISNKASPRLRVMPAGRGGDTPMIIGSGDRHSETLFLFAPIKASRRVSIRYSLSSTEAAQRRMTKTIKRMLKEHPATATA